MTDDPTNTTATEHPDVRALDTMRNVLGDLHELLAGYPATPAGHAARILDRLSEELVEAAADVRKAGRV